METKESINKAYYEIIRENSKYNKYIKWYLKVYRWDKIIISSQGFKTKNEANYEVEKMIYQGKQGFPIGNMMSYTEYSCL